MPLYTASSTKLVAVFEGGLSDSLWSRTLNVARVSVANAFGSAVESAAYHERAFDGAGVGSGTDLASRTLLRAIDDDGASILIAGYVPDEGQLTITHNSRHLHRRGDGFIPAVAWVARKRPGVNILVPTRAYTNLSYLGLANVRAVSIRGLCCRSHNANRCPRRVVQA